LNRNYAYGWGGGGSSGSACAETYRGTAPWTGPEVARLRDYLRGPIDDGTLALYMDLHAYGAMFMCPWGYTTALPPDFNYMNGLMGRAVNDMWEENGRTYAYGSVANTIYIASGGSNDWAYGDGDCYAPYVIECFGSNFTPPVSFIRPMGAEIWAGMKRLGLDLMGSGRFAPPQ